MGGEHQDIPLDPAGGKFVASFVVAERVPTVIDLSRLGENEMRRFGADFLSELYRHNRLPLHLFVEEADEFAPQTSFGPDQARVLGAMQNIVRRGRSRGIGCTLVTQRSAVINKSVLTQTEALVVLQTTGPQDRKAVEDWIKYHGTPEERATIMESLPRLEPGTCWFYSPGWMQTLQKVRIREKWTFDSSATPRPGQVQAKPKSVAEVDLKKLSGQIAKAVDQAKANDPKELNKRIADLEKQLSAKSKTVPAASPTGPNQAQIERQIRTEAAKAVTLRDQQWVELISSRCNGLDQVIEPLSAAIRSINVLRKHLRSARPDIVTSWKNIESQIAVPAPASVASKPITSTRPSSDTDTGLGRCERTILGVLAQFPNGRSKNAVSIQSGYSLRSSTFQNALSKLRTGGFMEGRGDCLLITQKGLGAARDVPPLPRGRDLLEFWCQQLGKCEASIVRALWDASGQMSRSDVAGVTGYSLNSSTFQNALGRLRTLELITRGDPIRLSEVFSE